MGRSVFSAEAEKMFIQLWGEIPFAADKKMLSRAAQVAIVTEKLN